MSDRPASQEASGERLPWLEPYREPSAKLAAARAAPPREKTRGRWWPVAGLLALIAVGGGGYWLGQREDGPAPRTAEVVRPAPVVAPVKPVAEEAAPVPAPVVAEPTPTAEPQAVEAKPVAAAPKPKVAPKPPRKPKVRSADTRRSSYERVVAKQRAATPPKPRAPVQAWPKMPSPGPAGQVIQLGAFSNRSRAEAAYRQRVARYPLLSRMPTVIVPIRPRGQLLYVLRLGTQSRQQSHIVCRNLRRSGDHCLVIG
ncbi:SPOR domain-containing protein [Sphingomonas mesophila]|uniref:SPOR domain-containing protein n=1 Tax=Sphingomonas mesophila TaxID=2303576 RepID=UPI000E56E73A|nr:SPOR domain-containing protein [Sphingomonas mesophila]